MRGYLLSRLGQTALVVFLSLTVVFFLVRLSGDPVLLFLPMDIQAKDINETRQRLGFNDPLAVQYSRFVANAARGDFDESLRYRRDALRLVLERGPANFVMPCVVLASFYAARIARLTRSSVLVTLKVECGLPARAMFPDKGI